MSRIAPLQPPYAAEIQAQFDRIMRGAPPFLLFRVMAGHAPLVSTLRAGMIDVNVDGKDDRYFIRGGFAEISPAKITVLAEEALPMTEMDLAVLDQRIADAQEDEIAAKTDSDRQHAAQLVDDLKLVRAAF